MNGIIGLSIALLSLQFDSVPIFFQIIFPKVGIGLSIILASVILLGMFIPYDKSQGMAKIFLTIAGVVGVVILLTTFDDYTWWSGGFWQQNMSAIIAGIILIVLVLVIVNSGKTERTSELFKPYGFPVGARGV